MPDATNELINEVHQLCYDEGGELIVPREIFDKLVYSEPYPIKNITMDRLEHWKEQTSKLKIKADEADLLLEKLTSHYAGEGHQIAEEIRSAIESWRQ